MNQHTTIRSNSVFKRALALICMMLSIASFFGCINIEPMLASAYSTYTYKYTLSGKRVDGGPTLTYSNDSKAVKYECSASWISVSQSYSGGANGTYTFSINVKVNDNKALSVQGKRYGYVKIKDKSGNVLRQYQIIQEQPYVRVYGNSQEILNSMSGEKGSSMNFKVVYNCPFSVWVESPYTYDYTITKKYGENYSAGIYEQPYGAVTSVSLKITSKKDNTNDKNVMIYAGRKTYNSTASSSLKFHHYKYNPQPITYVCQKSGITYSFQTYDRPKEGVFTITMVGDNFYEFTGAKSATYTMNFEREDLDDGSGAYIYRSYSVNTGFDHEELNEEGFQHTSIGRADMNKDGSTIVIHVKSAFLGSKAYTFYRQ